jgi:aldehyde dehydrogenase (NAD+)
MGYIDSGKKDGATVHIGGDRHGTEGYFINPTIFTDVKPEMKIVQEEIFGPVAVVIKFEDEEGRSIASFTSFLPLAFPPKKFFFLTM